MLVLLSRRYEHRKYREKISRLSRRNLSLHFRNLSWEYIFWEFKSTIPDSRSPLNFCNRYFPLGKKVYFQYYIELFISKLYYRVTKEKKEINFYCRIYGFLWPIKNMLDSNRRGMAWRRSLATKIITFRAAKNRRRNGRSIWRKYGRRKKKCNIMLVTNRVIGRWWFFQEKERERNIFIGGRAIITGRLNARRCE